MSIKYIAIAAILSILVSIGGYGQYKIAKLEKEIIKKETEVAYAKAEIKKLQGEVFYLQLYKDSRNEVNKYTDDNTFYKFMYDNGWLIDYTGETPTM